MKLVPDAKGWYRWWSVRLSVAGGVLLTMVEAFPHAIATVLNTLPVTVTEQVGDETLRVIGIICVIASPIARVIKQQLPDRGDQSD